MSETITYMDDVKGNGVQTVGGNMVSRIKAKANIARMFDDRLTKQNVDNAQEKDEDVVSLSSEALDELYEEEEEQFPRWMQKAREMIEEDYDYDGESDDGNSRQWYNDEEEDDWEYDEEEYPGEEYYLPYVDWDSILIQGCSEIMSELKKGALNSNSPRSGISGFNRIRLPERLDELEDDPVERLLCDYNEAMQAGAELADNTRRLVKTTLIMAGAGDIDEI